MKTNQMIKFLFVSVLGLAMTGCSATAQNNGLKRTSDAAYKTKLEGQWENPNDDQYLDFHKDGTVNIYTYDENNDAYVSQNANYTVNQNNEVTVTTNDNEQMTITDIDSDEVKVNGEDWSKVDEEDEVTEDEIENEDTESDNDDSSDDEDEENTLNAQLQGCWMIQSGDHTVVSVFNNGSYQFFVIYEDNNLLIAKDSGTYSIDSSAVNMYVSNGASYHTTIKNMKGNSFNAVNDEGESYTYKKITAESLNNVLSQLDASYAVTMNEYMSGQWKTIIEQKMQAEEDQKKAEEEAKKQQEQAQKEQEEYEQKQKQIEQENQRQQEEFNRQYEETQRQMAQQRQQMQQQEEEFNRQYQETQNQINQAQSQM